MTKHYQMLLMQAREERGWSQKDVAEKIDLDPIPGIIRCAGYIGHPFRK